jgi:hypothetical protein
LEAGVNNTMIVAERRIVRLVLLDVRRAIMGDIIPLPVLHRDMLAAAVALHIHRDHTIVPVPVPLITDVPLLQTRMAIHGYQQGDTIIVEIPDHLHHPESIILGNVLMIQRGIHILTADVLLNVRLVPEAKRVHWKLAWLVTVIPGRVRGIMVIDLHFFGVCEIAMNQITMILHQRLGLVVADLELLEDEAVEVVVGEVLVWHKGFIHCLLFSNLRVICMTVCTAEGSRLELMMAFSSIHFTILMIRYT